MIPSASINSYLMVEINLALLIIYEIYVSGDYAALPPL